jgi:hypothetical protein
VAPVLAVLIAGCTVTTHADDDAVVSRCDEDPGISCASPAVGYSCIGSARPADNDASLVCGDGVVSAGETTYCCATRPVNACAPDASITSCGATATPYTCTGTATPVELDPALDCGPGVAAPGGALSYCCNVTMTATSACGVDATLTSCGDVSTGYRCTGGVTPTDEDDKLVCGQGVDGGDGTEAFCCFDFTSTTCAADPNVVGCAGNSYGFSCTSTASPGQENSALLCSAPVAGVDGKSLYCCSQ